MTIMHIQLCKSDLDLKTKDIAVIFHNFNEKIARLIFPATVYYARIIDLSMGKEVRITRFY